MATTHIPLVAHLIYRLDFGGLETLLAECINRMPVQRYRHAIICLTDYTKFSEKIVAPDVQIIALHKPPGLGLGTHIKLLTLLRSLKPAILHTYNLAAIEYSLTAVLAGVPIRIHAEHGRDAGDPFGRNRKHNLLRRLLVPVIDCYVPVSCDLQHWLKEVVGIPDAKNRLINNGVDTETFTPKPGNSRARLPQTMSTDDIVIGTVGRIQDVKNHLGLIDAFIELRLRLPSHRSRLRLAIIGDGPLLPALKKKITDAGIADVVWLAGARNDIAEIMPAFSVFVLSSIAEGTPVTLLEAMAAGLPVVATQVGGIPEIVEENVTGKLVPANNAVALAGGITPYVLQPQLREQHGAAARERAVRHYSINAMIGAYIELYDALSKAKAKPKEMVKPCAE